MDKDYDKLSTRIIQILLKFNNGESFSVSELAEEFSVSERSIQRDLQKLASLPIKKEKGKYSLESWALGKFQLKHLQEFALLSGIKTLYPRLDGNFIADILNKNLNDKNNNKFFLIKNSGFDKVDYDKFELLSKAIIKYKQISLTYKQKDRILKPYKLLNKDGIWYLLADEAGKLKHFTLNKIENLKEKEESFKIDDELYKDIVQSKQAWLGDSKECLLRVDKKAWEYFSRKSFLSHFELSDEDEQFFFIKTSFAYEDEILNIVKLFIPYIFIISPTSLKEKLNESLRAYLNLS
ncbi:transcriptional regulator [Campylobacter sp. MIT 99-7217]|uniref:helix-turn-helix transcriptional regulator n=1 Tax=Campylobacter sp. MIT 99-7217 TaxID=535091 RepID=UPI0011582810|nr:WYL domain-containing protein [Campylobacter sp. MIT 99-7217]TQR33133.1 transcriptional regulator [Campylobacter sp. MIT 99-7217]